MDKSIYHIVIFNNSEKDTELVNRIVETSNKYPAFVLGTSVDFFEKLLLVFPPDLEFYLWFHLNGLNKDGYGNYKDIEAVYKSFARKFPPVVETPLFLTTGKGKSYKSSIEEQLEGIKNVKLDRLVVDNPMILSESIKDKNGNPILPFKALDFYSTAQNYYKQSYQYTHPKYQSGNLQLDVGTEALQAIIGEMVKEETVKGEVWVTPLESGFSGAYVFKIEYDNKYREGLQKVIKINKAIHKLDREVRAGRQLKLAGVANTFAALNRIKNPIFGYGVLIFEFERNMALKKFIRQKIEINGEEEIKNTVSIILHAIKTNQEILIADKPAITKGSPWKDRNIDNKYYYKGLSMQQIYSNMAMNNIRDFVKWYNLNDYLNQEEQKFIPDFWTLLKDNNTGNELLINIDNHLKITTPLASFHGDAHTSNIMVDTDGGHPTFIDFGLMNTDEKILQHAFLDYAKLSVDLETSCISDELLIKEGKAILNRWANYHRTFCHASPIPKDEMEAKDPVWQIYKAQCTIRDFVIDNYSEVAALNHFNLVRLHYLLETISYGTVEREKLIFAVIASIQIIHFLNTHQFSKVK